MLLVLLQPIMNIKKNNRKFWDTPWGYGESFLIGCSLILLGLAFEAFTAHQNPLQLIYPYNLYILLSYCGVLVVLYHWFSDWIIIRWLTKVPASITSITLVTLVVMAMGIIPQTPSVYPIISTLGLDHITTHSAFYLTILFFLTCLGLISIKRIYQWKWSNLGFIVNHLGLFIALLAGILGSGDLERLSLDLYEGHPSIYAYNAIGTKTELPFAVYLNDFKIEEYAPKLALVDNSKGEIVHNNGKNLFLIEKESQYSYDNYSVEILDFLSSSSRVKDGYFFVNEKGSPPSAKIRVTNHITHTITEGWVCSGSFKHPFEALKVSDEYSFVMTLPEAKKFSSDVSILNPDGSRLETMLEVNKPFSYKGYKLYQLSYNEKMGKWSNLSTIELVKDPWLPIVYIGMFMMIAGAIYMFWVGNNIKNQIK